MSARIEVHQEVFLKITKKLNKINNMTYAFEESRFNTCLCFFDFVFIVSFLCVPHLSSGTLLLGG